MYIHLYTANKIV